MKKKILLVDDNAELRSEFRVWFPEYSFTELSSAEEALRALARPNDFDLVVMDVQMPGMDGLTALERIKSSARRRRVLIMTGYSSKETAIKALTARADGYVEKPFDISTMRAAIEKQLLSASGADGPGELDMDGKVEHVKRFVEANCLGRVSLRDAAAAVCLSPKYLSRLFHERTGMKFEDFKLRARMSRARKLLRSTSMSVKQVSARLGYSNAESFIRQFEKIVKATPSCYRRSRHCRPR
jgi:YesN/AraC family two-component response regulator